VVPSTRGLATVVGWTGGLVDWLDWELRSWYVRVTKYRSTVLYFVL
jgi:hypothetical protein